MGWQWLYFPSLALIPTLFLSMSSYNLPRNVVRAPWMLVTAMLFLGSIMSGYWLGAHNGMPTSTLREWVGLVHDGFDVENAIRTNDWRGIGAVADKVRAAFRGR